jgi:hypothetical protein
MALDLPPVESAAIPNSLLKRGRLGGISVMSLLPLYISMSPILDESFQNTYCFFFLFLLSLRQIGK